MFEAKTLFASLEVRGKVWKKNEQIKEIEENRMGGLWGVNFSS